jgi:hypothetical protein
MAWDFGFQRERDHRPKIFLLRPPDRDRFRKCAGLEWPRRIVTDTDLKKSVITFDDDQAGQSGEYINAPGSAFKGGWTN